MNDLPPTLRLALYRHLVNSSQEFESLHLEEIRAFAKLRKLSTSASQLTKAEKSDLTNKTTLVDSEGVKDKWLNLKKQIQKATTDAGSKSKLAAFLDVDLTQLSKWLTDSDSAREPGAEYTLQMQAWVNDPKRQ